MRRAATSPRPLSGRAVSCIPDDDQSDLAWRSNMRRSMVGSLSCCDQSRACPLALEFGLAQGTALWGATQYRREPAFIVPGNVYRTLSRRVMPMRGRHQRHDEILRGV